MLARVLALTVALLTTAVPALADNLSLMFSSSAGTGSVSLDATSQVSPGVYRVTSASGNINGSAITTLLPPGTYPGDAVNDPNDNLIYFPGSPVLDENGLSFLLASGQYLNLYYFSGNYAFVNGSSLTDVNIGTRVTNVSLMQTGPLPTGVGVSPEPSSLLLFGTGLLGMVGAARRRFA